MSREQSGLSVYVAADFARAKEAQQLAERVRAAGNRVVSSWHVRADPLELASAGTVGGPPEEAAGAAASRNLREVDAADIVLVLTTGELARGGRHFETGYGYALRKRIVLVGVVEHAFHHLDGIDVALDADDALGLISGAR